jgi:hypothetical protein
MNTEFTKEKMETLEKVNEILFKIKSKNNNLIFVYTPPKVGSTSLVSSIRISASTKFSVLHIHDDLMLNVLTGYNGISVNDVILYNKILGKNVFVIDIFRTPIEIKISEYFEKLSCYHFNNSEENIKSYSLEKITNRFNKLFPHLSNKDYFKEIYNIPFPEKFDVQNKFLLVEEKGIKYIKLRLMDSHEWGNILTRILETEIFIVNDYKTENKKIGELYNNFKNNYKIPCNFISSLIECKVLNYYLTLDEITNYVNSWGQKGVDKETIPYTKEEYSFYNNLCLENKFYSDFQYDHYIDVGCICKPCSMKRKEILQKVKNGEEVKDKIVHYENMLNYRKDIINHVQQKVSKMKKINKINKNPNKINNLFTNIISSKR